MATMFDDVNAKCPYFFSSNKREISCEGISEGCEIMLRFKNHKLRDAHKQIFCDEKFRNCEIYKILEEKYD